MSIFEFDIEKEIKKLRRSEFNYGKDVGHEEGLEEGKSLGREEGLAAGAAGILRICQESGFSRQEALKKLICTMQLDEEKAAEYINRYWNKA